MRKQYINILKDIFYDELTRTRYNMGLTQEEMADRLFMACRTYVNLDHGKSGCSALTLALYLIYICEDPMCFLQKLRSAFDSCDNDVA